MRSSKLTGRKVLVMELDRRDKLPWAESPPVRLHVGTLVSVAANGKANVELQGRTLEEVSIHGTAVTGDGVFVLYAGSTALVLGKGEGGGGNGGGGSYLPLAGGTLTGFLTLHANPTDALHAAPRQYVDSQRDLVIGLVEDVILYNDETFLPLAGGTMTGPLLLSGNPTVPFQAATKAYVDAMGGGGGGGSEHIVDPVAPVAPIDGLMWTNPDEMMYGPPFDPDTLGYVHVQGSASAFWTITHPLDFQPNVAVIDSTGEQVEGTVDYVNADTITVGFSAAFAGTAYLS